MQQFIWLYLEGYACIAIPNKQNVSEVHINAAEDDEFALADLAGMYDVSLMVQKKVQNLPLRFIMKMKISWQSM